MVASSSSGFRRTGPYGGYGYKYGYYSYRGGGDTNPVIG